MAIVQTEITINRPTIANKDLLYIFQVLAKSNLV